MKADPRIVQDVCAGCAPRPDPTLHYHPVPWYVGKHIKRAFHSDEGHVEHMWVKVTGANGDTLAGTLASAPTLVEYLQHGDDVSVAVTEIEAVTD